MSVSSTSISKMASINISIKSPWAPPLHPHNSTETPNSTPHDSGSATIGGETDAQFPPGYTSTYPPRCTHPLDYAVTTCSHILPSMSHRASTPSLLGSAGTAPRNLSSGPANSACNPSNCSCMTTSIAGDHGESCLHAAPAPRPLSSDRRILVAGACLSPVPRAAVPQAAVSSKAVSSKAGSQGFGAGPRSVPGYLAAGRTPAL